MTLFILLAVLLAVLSASPLRGAMIKPGAIVAGIKSEMFPGLAVVRAVYGEHGYPWWITSGIEGKHSARSLHPEGLAADFRVRDPGGAWSIPEGERKVMVGEIAARAGDDYDVVLKPDHIHLEYQPAGQRTFFTD